MSQDKIDCTRIEPDSSGLDSLPGERFSLFYVSSQTPWIQQAANESTCATMNTELFRNGFEKCLGLVYDKMERLVMLDRAKAHFQQ